MKLILFVTILLTIVVASMSTVVFADSPHQYQHSYLQPFLEGDNHFAFHSGWFAHGTIMWIPSHNGGLIPIWVPDGMAIIQVYTP